MTTDIESLLDTKTKARFWWIISLLIGVILFIGGLGQKVDIAFALGGLVSVILLSFVIYKKGKLRLPKGFLIYNLFLIFFGLSLIWSLDWQKSLGYLVLYVSGGLFWVAFFNLKGESKNFIENIIIILGILFGIFTLGYKYLDFAPFGRTPFSLVYPAIANHHHIGDFWAIATVIVIHKVFVKKKYLYSLLFIPGSAFLVLSLSKSAYLALAVGAYFIFYYKGWIQNYKKVLVVFILLTTALFLFAGAQKTTLFSRPYFFQAIAGLVNYLFGVGYGNFERISSECFGCFNDRLMGFSTVTHNLVLEVLAGMGILGLSFVYWLYLVFKDLLEKTEENSLIITASFFTLFTNFFFDYTYFIPTMFWLFFILLGIAQNTEESNQMKGRKILLYIMSSFVVISSLLIGLGLITIKY